MEEFPPNNRHPGNDSEIRKPKESTAEKAVQGKVIRRRTPITTRFRNVFFADMSAHVVQNTISDVLLPALKDTVADFFSTTMERALFGETRGPARRSSARSGAFGSGSGPVSYNRYSSPTTTRTVDPRQSNMSRRARVTHDFDEIILESRQEAENVLSRLDDILAEFKVVSVSNLYELVGETFHSVDEKWGWVDLSGASVSRVNSGAYLLNMPKTEPID